MGLAKPEYTIYQKFVEKSLGAYLPYVIQGQPPGYYILRISKYIMLVEKLSGYYAMAESFRVIGLEAQEVTTCHAKEGEALDQCIEKTWPEGDLQQKEQEACVLTDTL